MKTLLSTFVLVFLFSLSTLAQVNQINEVGPIELSPQNKLYKINFDIDSPSTDQYFIELTQGNGEEISIPNCSAKKGIKRYICLLKRKWVFFWASLERPYYVEVTLNGQKIINKREFNWTSGDLVKKITVDEQNKLKIKVRGRRTSSVSFRLYKITEDNNQPPVAQFEITPDSTDSTLFSFDASGSTDDGNIDQYRWSFGDGQSDEGVQVSYSYANAGTYNVTLTVTDDGGLTNQISQPVTVVINQPPVAVVTSNVSSGEAPLMVLFDGSGSSDPDGDALSYSWSFSNGATSTEIMPAILFEEVGSFQAQLTVTDTDGASASSSIQIEVTPIILPPDPAAIAPPLSPGQSDGLQDSISFLYTSNPPVIRNVVESAIQPQLTSWVRGRVVGRDNQPLSGVRVSVLDHPEYGLTYSRPDGMYDLVVNGGMTYTVDFSNDRVLPLQRRVETKALGSVVLNDVVMTELDPKVLVMTNSSPLAQFFTGTTSNDNDGARVGRLFIPANTTGQIVLPGGGTMTVPNLDIRITEYTVGENGLKAMPGTLPPTTAYTYAMELSVDQAIGMNSNRVEFDQPISYYVDNFVNAPVGALVPFGFYNLDSGVWESKENGLVISILGIENGEAILDTDGTGQPNAEAEAAFEITSVEKQLLSQNYSIGDTFWRVQVDHFSPYDANYLGNFPDNLTDGDDVMNRPVDNDEKTCQPGGSFFEFETRTFGERFPVYGTPFNLTYKSDRTPGYKANSKIDIGIGSRFVGGNTAFVGTQFSIAGNKEVNLVSPSSSQNRVFQWDGLDAFGRTISGLQKAEIVIGNVPSTSDYVITRWITLEASASSGSRSATRSRASAPRGGPLFNRYYVPELLIPARLTEEQLLTSKYDVFLGLLDWRDQGFGGWSLDVHHSFNPTAFRLYRGDGSTRIEQMDHINPVIQNCFLRQGGCTTKTSGSPAISTSIGFPQHLKYLGDGRLLVGEDSGGTSTLIAVNTDQTIELLVSQGSDAVSENIPLSQVRIEKIGGLEQLPSGEIVFADRNRVRRINASGVVSTIAGSINLTEDSGDGGQALNAGFAEIGDLAVGPDGSLYVATDKTVRRIAADGNVETVAGRAGAQTENIFPDDLLFATQVDFGDIQGIDVDSDGALYIADNSSARISKIQPDGFIQLVLGAEITGFDVGDNSPAREAGAKGFSDLQVDSQGNIYFSNSATNETTGVIRRIDSNGFVKSFVGIPQVPNSPTENNLAGINAIDYKAAGVTSLALDSNDNLVFGERFKVSKVENLFAVTTAEGGFRIPSSDGSEIFLFDKSGRHLETLHSMTRATKYKFNYTDGLVTGIEDGDGKVTRVVRDGVGNIEKIISHYGVETIFSTTDGYITQMTTPENEGYSFNYNSEGLLLRIDKPDGASTVATYDSEGMLRTDIDGEGGFFNLQSVFSEEGEATAILTAENRQTRVETIYDSQNSTTKVVRAESGLETTIVSNGRSTSSDTPGIFNSSQTMQRDPFLPAGFIEEDLNFQDQSVSYRRIRDRSVVYDDPLNEELSEFTITDTYRLRSFSASNPDQITTEVYRSINNETTITSPEGRVSRTQADDQGRPTLIDLAGIDNISMTYDGDGRLSSINQGSRLTQMTYDSGGYLASVTNPLNQTTLFVNDANGRVIKQTLADGREIDFRYDRRGNLTGIRPSGKPWHEMDYNLQNLLTAYRPPSLSGVSTDTNYSYNLDKDLIGVSRPDGKNISYSFNLRKQLESISTVSGTTNFSYSQTTRQLSSAASEDGINMSLTYSGDRISGYNWQGLGQISINFDQRGNRTSDSTGTSLFFDGDYLPVGDTSLGNGNINFTFNSQNRLIERINYNQPTYTDLYSYNSFGELSEHRMSSPFANLSFSYSRDALGRITSLNETLSLSTDSKSYQYDVTGRLVEITESRGTTNYTYDSNSNITQVNSPEGTFNGVYDEQDRLVSFGDWTFSHNSFGELTSKTNTTSQESTSYSYDSFGNLKQVNLPDGRSISYEVDGFNRRVSRSTDGGQTRETFVYRDQLNIGRWQKASGELVFFSYASKPHVPDVMYIGSLISSNRFRIITDHLGSVREVINSQGQVVQAITYDAYGKVLSDTNPGFQPFGYAGGLYDHETGLVRFGARDYDASVGRFLSKDPILFAGGDPNLYAYVGSDPVNFIDPWGLDRITVELAREFLEQRHPNFAPRPGTQIIESRFPMNMFPGDKRGMYNPINDSIRIWPDLNAQDASMMISHEAQHQRYPWRSHPNIYDTSGNIGADYQMNSDMVNSCMPSGN